jgi:hypothetical protein
MYVWRVWYDNGAAVLVEAETPAAACDAAEALATADGYAGLRAVKAECLSR